MLVVIAVGFTAFLGRTGVGQRFKAWALENRFTAYLDVVSQCSIFQWSHSQLTWLAQEHLGKILVGGVILVWVRAKLHQKLPHFG